MTETKNISNVLQLLKELDKTNSFEVYLPTFTKTVSFKQLNAEQLKNILKASIDSPIYKTKFILTSNNIIKENILDSDIDASQLNILDKLLFLLKTRIECISPTYTFYFSEEEINDFSLTENNFTASLTESYNNFVNNKLTFEKLVIKNSNYEITASLPTLETENRLETELHDNVSLQITDAEELRDTIGDTFINEITKYISELKINEQVINLNALSFKERITIVEQLPITVINQILKYIEDYKVFIQPLTTYRFNDIEKEIAFNSTIFNI